MYRYRRLHWRFGVAADANMLREYFFRSIFGAILLTAAISNSAVATGYWNLPSTFCQCIGCGFGAGYHAPLLLGPISHEGWLAVNERRLPCPPAAANAGYGFGHHGHDFAQPTMMEPKLQPTGPELRPVSRKHRPLFLR
jgi:hypothetical protein